jgi:hypothetical protein
MGGSPVNFLVRLLGWAVAAGLCYVLLALYTWAIASAFGVTFADDDVASGRDAVILLSGFAASLATVNGIFKVIRWFRRRDELRRDASGKALRSYFDPKDDDRLDTYAMILIGALIVALFVYLTGRALVDAFQ